MNFEPAETPCLAKSLAQTMVTSRERYRSCIIYLTLLGIEFAFMLSRKSEEVVIESSLELTGCDETAL